jgi:GAF domain-containing protein
MSDQQSGLLDLMTRVAQSSGEPADRDETLRLITQAAKKSIRGTDAVSISIKDAAEYTTLAPTDDLSMSGDKLQYALGEGPCVDAAGGESVIRTGELVSDPRWPEYGPRAAAELGVTSQVAFEMYSGEKTYGGLNLYSRSSGAFNDEEGLSLAQLFASQAANVMGKAATITQYTEALSSRKVIGQAIGLVMARYDLDDVRAFQFLVRMSSTGNMKLRAVAQGIVDAANQEARESQPTSGPR